MKRRGFVPRAAILVALISISGCGTLEDVALSFRDLTPHEAYAEGLRAAGLSETALSVAWLAAAEVALTDAPDVSLPFQEEGYLFPDTPEARSYRVRLRRGQVLSVDVTTVPFRMTRSEGFMGLRFPDGVS